MNSEKIGEVIKKIRTDNNLTQQEFANKYGVTYQAVSKWENGKNLPDIMLLKDICRDFNVSIDDLLEGEESKKKNKKTILIIVLLIVLFSIGLILIFNHNKTYKFKTISSSCDEFKITGSIAYDKKKSSIYISDVSYCGKKEENIYKEIDCTLYEKSNNSEKKIEKCKSNMQNVTLDEYLKDVSIIIDDYNQTCRNMTDYQLHLKINAKEKDNKTVTYDIPLTLNESCKK